MRSLIHDEQKGQDDTEVELVIWISLLIREIRS